MPFPQLLGRLVRSVDGAQGAILMDQDCEYVWLEGSLDPYHHKLMGAYQGILLMQMASTARRRGWTEPDRLVTGYEKAQFITRTLKSGYFLVLSLRPGGNVGRALVAIEAVAERINEEIV